MVLCDSATALFTFGKVIFALGVALLNYGVIEKAKAESGKACG